jgi:hypothetical protein
MAAGTKWGVVPTSVLLAVLAAAGLLALAPALVRRYDATERLAAERAQSTARVLERKRRRRTVPGPRPLFAPRIVVAEDVAPAAPATVSALQMATVEISTVAFAGDVGASDGDSGVTTAGVGRAVWLPIGPSGHGRRRHVAARPGEVGLARGSGRGSGPSRRRERRRTARRRQRVPQPPAVYRRRRVLLSLVVFNAVELVGVFTVSPGFWTGFAVTSLMLVGYLVHLRNESLAGARRARVEQRRAAVVAAVQAEIREEQARRAAARRDALRRAAAARAAAQREAVRLTQRYVDFDPARRIRLRGQSYETGGWDGRAVGQ